MNDFHHIPVGEPNNGGLHLDSSWMSDSPYPTSPYRRSRVSHASNPSSSWIDQSFAQQTYPGSFTTSRPLTSPSLSRGMSGRSQWPTVSEQPLEPTPESPPLDPVPPPGPSEFDTTEQDVDPSTTEHMDVPPMTDVAGVGDITPIPISVPTRDLERGEPEVYEQARQKGKGFVGGFVAGLRNLPRLAARNPTRGRQTLRKDLPGGANLADPIDDLPRYDDPGQPVAGPSNVRYVEGMDMPREHPVSSQLSYIDNNNTNEDGLMDAPLENPHETHPPLDVPLHSPPVVATPVLIDPRTARVSTPVFVENQPTGLVTPVLVEPRPTRDYAKMESPVRDPPRDDSISAHIIRIRDFLVELKNLPWIAQRVTVDYYPEQSSRARLNKGASGSWYSPKKGSEKVDLLATPAQVKPTEMAAHSDYDARSLVRRRTPSMSVTSHGGSNPSARRHTGSAMSHNLHSPGESSYGRRYSRHSRSSRNAYSSSPMFVLSPALGTGMQLTPVPTGVHLPANPDGSQVYYLVHSTTPPQIPTIPSPSLSPSATHIPYPNMSGTASNFADASKSR